MKFVALLSGGKDSCCNVWKCEQEGHELVCLANLCPPEGAGEELNSFMYQSAAHGVIPKLAECFGVPLIRQDITGSAVCQDLDYVHGSDDTTRRDEVEDLYELLLKVVQQYPEVKGVSCGAILSTYQRLRVENVCKRLKLTPLTYLWQMDRNALLDDLCNNNFEVVLVKVAGAGLDPYKHLGKQLSLLRPQLHSLNQKLGLDLCGEGGEYESLVLDCPMFAKTGKRLRIVASEVLLDEEDCSVGNLLIKDCQVEARGEENSEGEYSVTTNDIIVQGEFDDLQASARVFNGMLDQGESLLAPRQFSNKLTHSTISSASTPPSSRSYGEVPYPVSSACPGGFGNTGLLLPTSDSKGASIQMQLDSIFAYLPAILAPLGVSQITDAVFIHLFLTKMTDFGDVNEAYCRHFGKYPPSRSCIAVAFLPNAVRVAMDVTYLRHSYSHLMEGRGKCFSGLRSVLLVQSLSHWAPLCIGPYAQSNTLMKQLVLAAGQIPLRPGSMSLMWNDDRDSSAGGNHGDSAPWSIRDRLSAQLLLSLRHAQRILRCSSDDGGIINDGAHLQDTLHCTVYVNAPLLATFQHAESLAKSALSAAPSALEVESFVENFVRQAISQGLQAKKDNFEDENGNENENENEDEYFEEDEGGEIFDKLCGAVPVQVVGVKGIPRGALVEVEIVAAANGALSTDDQNFSERIGAKMNCSGDSDDEECTEFAFVTSDIKRVESSSKVDQWPTWNTPAALAVSISNNISV